MSIFQIDAAMAPPLGDLRQAKHGDWVYVHEDAASRSDWSRVWEAVGVAFVRGARVVQLVGD